MTGKEKLAQRIALKVAEQPLGAVVGKVSVTAEISIPERNYCEKPKPR